MKRQAKAHSTRLQGGGIRLAEGVLGIRLAELADAVHPVEGAGEEGDGLLDPFVGLGATEAKEAGAGGPEAFASQAGDAETVVGAVEEVKGQAVRGQLQTVADLADVGKDVERAGGGNDVDAVDPGQAGGEPLDLALEPGHVVARVSASCSSAASAAA